MTLRSIARQAGIAAPSIYRHFADLDEIMQVLVEDAFEDLRDALIEADRGTTATARLTEICGAYLAYASEHPQQYRIMFGGVWLPTSNDEDAESSERMSALGLSAFDVLVQAVQDCVVSGASQSDNAEDDAVALWASLHGLAELRRSAPSFPWPATIMEHVIQRIVLISG